MSTSLTSAELHGSKILVIDDSPEIQATMRALLKAEQYVVIAAIGGDEGIRRAREDRPDLILLDQMMPGLSGQQVLTLLKDDPLTKDIPVIMLTAVDEVEDKVRALRAGAFDYVTKPFAREEALTRIRVHLENSLLKREIQTRNAELMYANEVCTRFMRIARHDLRNPISAVRLIANYLREYPEDLPSRIEMLEQAAAHMLELANHYLDPDILESPAVREESVETSILPIVDVAISDAEGLAMPKHTKLVTELSKDLPELPLKRLSIHQVLANLLSNAIKFSPGGTTVTLRITLEPDYMHVSVLDEGPGVRPEERDRLYTENAVLTNQPTGGESSHGFGLWICKQLVEDMHGSIMAEFPEAGGSVFSIRLPLKGPEVRHSG